MDVQLRQALAIEVAQTVAAKYGLPYGQPNILKDTNNTIVHLSPLPIVAKVNVEKRFRHASSSLEKELLVAGLLADSGAPVVRPCSSVPAGPHRMNSVELTFWDYCPADTFRPVELDEVGRSLRAIHNALLQLGPRMPPLPRFTLQLDEVYELLQRPEALPQLPERDRVFLGELVMRTREVIATRKFKSQALHGECNAQQTLTTAAGVVWLDFEVACTGPREWDLATLDEEAVEAYGGGDSVLMPLMRTARILCITTWCWTQPDRGPEVREAAEYHLGRLKLVATHW
jgi:hypothetical protein